MTWFLLGALEEDGFAAIVFFVKPGLDVDEEPTPATTKRPLPKQESVLRQLNRGAAERQQEKKKARSRAAEPDPLQGF